MRIALVCASPMLATGLAEALADSTLQDGYDGAQAAVVHCRDGADALAQHAALPPALPAVMLGDDLREVAQRAAAEPRALALLSPRAAPAQLRAALAAVVQGLSVRAAGSEGPATARIALDHEPLTPRELEVFEFIGKGLSNRDIAGVLGISAHTAKYHVGQILAKVGAATRAEAVSTGLKLGLIGV